jgi:AraC-like DNA-binding protein
MPEKPAVQRLGMQLRSASTSLGGITIVGLGVRQTVALGGPRIFGQYALVYILAGAGAYSDANGWQQPLQPGDLILVFPELKHTYGPLPGTTWVTTFLCFQGPVFDLWREKGILDSRHPVLRLQPVDEWSRRIESVLGAARQIGFFPPLVETCRLLELLGVIITGAGRAQSRQDRLWVEQACGLIEAGLVGAPDWEKIAAQFGLTPEGFRKRFARLSGYSPARYRMGRLIDRACELMCESRLADFEIAGRLGFCDEFYFSRRFKQITGKSPRQFRQSLPLQDR